MDQILGIITFVGVKNRDFGIMLEVEVVFMEEDSFIKGQEG